MYFVAKYHRLHIVCCESCRIAHPELKRVEPVISYYEGLKCFFCNRKYIREYGRPLDILRSGQKG
jgi:hypothetical protein